MGDGTVRKVAIVINGDTEDRHLKNVDDALAIFSKGNYETLVASPVAPNGHADRYVTSSRENIQAALKELKSTLDDDDELVIYVTGHGTADGFCASDSCGTKDLIALLDGLPFGQRTAIMDQCYGGNWNKLFTDDPKTLFISCGSKDETVCCSKFAPHFLSGNVPDQNKDGVISWMERYSYAMEMNPDKESVPQFVMTDGYKLEGKPPFPANVVNVNSREELEGAISRLEPGQKAVMMFSAPWCGICREFKPDYEQLAADMGGKYLFLYSDNDELAQSYGISGFPTIKVYNHDGIAVDAGASKGDIASVLMFPDATKMERWALLRQGMEGPNYEEAYSSYLRGSFHMKPEEAAAELPELRKQLERTNGDNEIKALYLALYRAVLERAPVEAIRAEVAPFREYMLKTDSSKIFDRAFTQYTEHIFTVLSKEEKEKEISALLATLQSSPSDEVSEKALKTFNAISWYLPAKDAVNVALLLRNLYLTSPQGYGVQQEAIKAYHAVLLKLDKCALAAEAAELRNYFNHNDPEVRLAAVQAYKGILFDEGPVFSKRLPDDELWNGIFDLAELQNNDLDRHVRSAAENVHQIAIFKAFDGKDVSYINKYAASVRERMLNRDGSVNWAAVSEYKVLADRLTAAEAREGANALRNIIMSGANEYLAAEAYKITATRLDTASADKEAAIWRAAMRERWQFEDWGSYYGDLANNVSNAEAVTAAAFFREYIASNDLQEEGSVPFVYDRFASRLKGNDADREAAAIRETMLRKGTKNGYSLARTYETLVHGMSLRAVNSEAKALREKMHEPDTSPNIKGQLELAYLGLVDYISWEEAMAATPQSERDSKIYKKVTAVWSEKFKRQGDMGVDSGQYEIAVGLYNKALLLNNNNYEAWLGAATALARLGRTEKAYACLERILSAERGVDASVRTEAYRLKAALLLKEDKKDEALECIKMAARLWPKGSMKSLMLQKEFDKIKGDGGLLDWYDRAFDEAWEFYFGK